MLKYQGGDLFRAKGYNSARPNNNKQNKQNKQTKKPYKQSKVIAGYVVINKFPGPALC